MTLTVEPARHIGGKLRVPGDKSISHRYAILAALADGNSTIQGYSPGSDCASTLSCLRALGVEINLAGSSGLGTDSSLTVHGQGLGGLSPAANILDAGNSGTTIRLLVGVLAAHAFPTTITGDMSLCRRPMSRIVEPLQRMGASIETTSGCPPLMIHGEALHGTDYAPEVASAQVKSAILLAGLHASGSTRVTEHSSTRDHTERALTAFGVHVEKDGRNVCIVGGQSLTSGSFDVPGDLSSAAFWAAAAAALPDSEVEIVDVGLNPTRMAFLEVLREIGAEVEIIELGTSAGEPCGSVRIGHRQLKPVEIEASKIPGLIDELPVLAALAAHGSGLYVSGAGELRTKESDRIAVLATGLRSLGATVDEYPDGFHIQPGRTLVGGTVDAKGDHRMAMAFAVAALGAKEATTIIGHEVVDVSYPDFFTVLNSIRQA